MYKTVWSILIVLLPFFAFSHPVSVKDSVGIMGYHSPVLAHNQLNYSFQHWFALGVHHIRRPMIKNSHATLATGNFLLKRWNGSGLQANIYGLIGGGTSELAGPAQGVGLAGLQFDIENRDYYFLAKHQQIFNEDRNEMRTTVVRAGLTPYVGQFEDLHSWFILEWQSNKFADQTYVDDLTPYLRLFYQNLLFEIGQSFNGITRFNYIVHF